MFLASQQHAAPANWQDLETLCAKLFRHLWKDDKVQRFGRNGQRQDGVDIVGRPHGGGIEGVQCRVKDATTHKTIALDEIEATIEEAERFDPPLTALTFAATAEPDVALQRKVLKIDEERRRSGRFGVALLSWKDLLDRIEEVPELAETYGSPSKTIIETRQTTLEIKEMVERGNAMLEVLQGQQTATAMVATPPSIDDLLGSEIDRYRDVLKENKAQLALDLLESVRAKRWDSASPKMRYRILTNIAVAKTRLGRTDGADDHIAALQFDPEAEHALCNVGHAYLIKGDFAKARETAQAAIAEYPKSITGHAVLLAAANALRDVDDPLSLVPDDLRGEAAVAFGIGNFYCWKPDVAAAREWLTRAFEKDPNPIEIKTALAEQLLGGVLIDQAAAISGQLSAGQKADLDRAADLFSDIWQSVKDTDIAPTQVIVAINLSTALRIKGKHAAAAAALDEALKAKPDDAQLRLQRALVAWELGNEALALEMALGIPDDLHPMLPLMRADLLIALNQPDEALARLDAIIAESGAADLRLRAKRLRVAAISKSKGAKAAIEAARALCGENDDFISKLTLAETLHAGGDDADAREVATKLASTKVDAMDPDKAALAALLAQLGAFSEAAVLYGSLVREPAHSLAFHRWIACLVNSDQRAKALEAIDRLPSEQQEMPEYLAARAAVHERAGDRAMALTFYDRCVAADPSNIDLALRRILVLYKEGERDLALQALDEIHLPEEPSAEDLMVIAQLRAEYGQIEEAVRIGYRARRIGFKDPRIHNAYSGLILVRPPEATRFLELDQITEEAAFALRERNGRERWFVMEEDPAGGDEIAPEDDLGRRVLGKKVGEKVVVSTIGPISDERTVSAIKHKALHALHETMERFAEWFPDAPGMFKMEVRQDAAGHADISEIVELLRAKRETADRGVAVYRSGKFPVAALARALSANPIELWFSLPSFRETEALCCAGTLEERTQAIELIRSKPRWIVDPITLVDMFALGIHEAVLAVAGRVGICQSSLDLLDELMEDRLHRPGEPRTTLSLGDKGLVRTETAPEAVEADREFLDGVRRWAEEKLELVPAMGRPDKPHDPRITDALGRAFHDVLLAAEGEDRRLLCEDLVFRSFAKGVGGIDGAWLQPFIWIAAMSGRLERVKYEEVLAKMLSARRSFIWVGDADLFCQAERSNFEVSPTFRALLRSLGKPTAIFKETMIVAGSVLLRIWTHPIDLRRKRNLTFAILTGLTEQHPRTMPAMVRQMIGVARLTTGGHFMLQAIRDWCFGHFMPYPEELRAEALARVSRRQERRRRRA
jgi:tetratricopeptide (TPR) repeat protein